MKLASLSFVAIVVLAFYAHGAGAVEVIYFWGNNATPPISATITDSVVPAPEYRSRAGDIRYGRRGVGDYGVVHFGTGKAGVLVKPYDSGVTCTLSDDRIGFLCGEDISSRVNTRFLYFWLKGTLEEEYLFSYAEVAVEPSEGRIVVSVARQGGDETSAGARRIGRGYYEVTLGSAVERESSVQTQASGSTSIGIGCNPVGVLGRRVQVRCTLSDGTTKDSDFYVIAVSGLRRPSHNHALFDVFKQNSYRTTARMDPRFSKASDDSSQSVTRVAEGRYRVELGPSANEGGHVQVTSMGLFGSKCHVAGWENGFVTIKCTRNGEPAQTPFSVMGATPLTGSVYPRQ